MRLRVFLMTILASGLAACGGGGSGSSSSSSSSGGGNPPASVDRAVLTYTAPTAAAPAGTTPKFEFTIENPSTNDATDVQLTVRFGAGLTRASGGSVECRASGRASCPSNVDSTGVTTLPGQSALRFSVYAMVAPGSTGTSSVSAEVVAFNDGVITNNTVQFNVQLYSADLSVSAATSASDLVSGDIAPFAITVANAGPDAARDVTLTRALGGRQSTTMSCTAVGGATCPAAMGPDMTVSSLPSGGSLQFSLSSQLAADALASVSASMRVQALGDTNYGNNNAVVSAYVRVPTASTSPTFVKFQSEPGDPVGLGGGDYSYTRVNSIFELEDYGDHIALDIRGDETWTARFHKPTGLARWQPGIYTDLLGAPLHDPATGGLHISGVGGGCDRAGWFNISNVVYTGDEITALDVVFAQHCTDAPGLRGQIHWVANDGSRPPGPVNPPPTTLWSPAAGATPASGNYLHLVSASGEPLLQGATETHTQANATFSVDAISNAVGFSVVGARAYSGEFRAMAPLTQLEPGYYVIAPGVWMGNPTNPGLHFRTSDRECVSGRTSGWFVVDSIAFDNAAVIAVDARFELRCDEGPPVRGQIHWRSDDPTQAPGPVPPPAGLWAPPGGAVPASGNVVYLEGMPNPLTGARPNLTYTPLDSIIQPGDGGMTLAGNRFHIDVYGDEQWSGDFQAMVSLPDLRVGYYGGIGAYPNHNPIKGGISWYGPTTCYATNAWFVIDSIHYSGSTVDAIELRFEEYCGTSTIPRRGYIRWSTADTRQPSPPVNPPPSDVWQPAPGTTPASGNYVYLVSEPASGPSETFIYTQATAELVPTTAGRGLEFAVNGDQRWLGGFVPMQPFTELQLGYYALPTGGSLAKGGVGWQRLGANSCGNGPSWFAVDEVTYQAGVLRSIDVRFERTCLAGDPTVRGKIHWRFDDPTAAPGPVVPPPAGLWQPPIGAVPPLGNVLYVNGEIGDFVSDGGTFLFTPPSYFQGGTGISEYYVGAQSATDSWSLHFKPMNSLPRMQVGYYPNFQALALGNPTRGRLDVGGRGRGCSQQATGWFVVDSVTYVGEQMTAIQMRFEQRCSPSAPALRGIVRWAQ